MPHKTNTGAAFWSRCLLQCLHPPSLSSNRYSLPQTQSVSQLKNKRTVRTKWPLNLKPSHTKSEDLKCNRQLHHTTRLMQRGPSVKSSCFVTWIMKTLVSDDEWMMMIAFLVFFFGLVLCELNLNLFSVVWCDVIVRCCTLDPLILCVKASNSMAIWSVQCVCLFLFSCETLCFIHLFFFSSSSS